MGVREMALGPLTFTQGLFVVGGLHDGNTLGSARSPGSAGLALGNVLVARWGDRFGNQVKAYAIFEVAIDIITIPAPLSAGNFAMHFCGDAIDN